MLPAVRGKSGNSPLTTQSDVFRDLALENAADLTTLNDGKTGAA
jgi:hypothetical protein